MGCTSSKHRSNRDVRQGPLSRSMSMPSHSTKADAGDYRSIQCMDMPFMVPPVKLRPVNEEPTPGVEEDLAPLAPVEGRKGPGESSHKIKKRRLYERSVTRVADNGKSYNNDESEHSSFCSDDPRSEWSHRPLKSFATEEQMQGITGLRLLLSPVTTPKHGFIMPSTRGASLSKSLSSLSKPANAKSSDASEVSTVKLKWLANEGDLEEPGSPLFDPSILATFEKALETATDDSWLSSDVSNGSSSRNLFSSPETCSDADSPEWPRILDPHHEGETGCRGANAAPYLNVVSQQSDTKIPIKLDYIENFEMKCPPGCDEKIVLYFTSLRGVRKTFEECCTLRMILKGYGVHVDERDVWMHSKFRQELTDVFGIALAVPRLFIKGRYIGGLEEVKPLNEEGVLGKLLEGLPTEWNDMCGLCGGIRFLPCSTCRGSCKVFTFNEAVARCPDCNENGLSMCPSCGW